MKRNLVSVFGLFILFTTSLVNAQSPINIHQATLIETGQKTKEVSTEEIRKILLEKSATVFADGRPQHTHHCLW